MKYKVGDKVVIKKSNSYWVPDMDAWIGKVMTIEKKGNYGYTMLEDDGRFLWNDNMIELVQGFRTFKEIKEINKEKVLNDREKEMVENPSHYNQGKYEVKDVIRDWKLNFALGSAIKYIARCEHKLNKKQDLEKAIFLIQDEIDNME